MRDHKEVVQSILEKTALYEKKKTEREAKMRRMIPALAVVLVGLCLGGFSLAISISAEAKEYASALEYFKTAGITTEGLSRAEIRAAYRKITASKENGEIVGKNEPSQGASDGKTNSEDIPGLEIGQEQAAPDEVQSFIDQEKWLVGSAGYTYEKEYSEQNESNEDGYKWISEETIVNCYDSGKQVWTVSVPCYVKDCWHLSGRTVLWGFAGETGNDTFIATVDDKGEVLWSKMLDHEFKQEPVYAVIDEGEGELTVLSRGSLNGVGFTRFDASGNELSFKVTELGTLGDIKAARLGDGYIIGVVDHEGENRSTLYMIGRNGNVLNRISYKSDGYIYIFQDMIEYSGSVILSAYAIPPQKTVGSGIQFPSDVARNVLDYMMQNQVYTFLEEERVWQYSVPDEFTQVVRDNFDAVLLVCDPETGEPKTFCSVDAAVGGKLSVDAQGRLVWEVQSIEAASTDLPDYAYTAVCKVFDYVFEEDGTLSSRTDTERVIRFQTVPGYAPIEN